VAGREQPGVAGYNHVVLIHDDRLPHLNSSMEAATLRPVVIGQIVSASRSVYRPFAGFLRYRWRDKTPECMVGYGIDRKQASNSVVRRREEIRPRFTA
jgi:hypothetical protein